MNCKDCHDRKFREDKVGRTKYITRAECRPAGNTNDRYGMFYIQVGANYIGRKFRVAIEELPDGE